MHDIWQNIANFYQHNVALLYLYSKIITLLTTLVNNNRLYGFRFL